MKKLLIISGSARNGNSKYIAKSVADWADDFGRFDVNRINLSDYNINYCDGCLYCDTTGNCHQSDDMQSLLDQIRVADGVVIISPTRWSLLSGDLKVFFDRWNPLAGKNIFDNKKCFNICVGQTEVNSSVSIMRALDSLRFFTEDAGFAFEGQFAFENCYGPDDAKDNSKILGELRVKVFDFLNKF